MAHRISTLRGSAGTLRPEAASLLNGGAAAAPVAGTPPGSTPGNPGGNPGSGTVTRATALAAALVLLAALAACDLGTGPRDTSDGDPDAGKAAWYVQVNNAPDSALTITGITVGSYTVTRPGWTVSYGAVDPVEETVALAPGAAGPAYPVTGRPRNRYGWPATYDPAAGEPYYLMFELTVTCEDTGGATTTFSRSAEVLYTQGTDHTGQTAVFTLTAGALSAPAWEAIPAPAAD